MNKSMKLKVTSAEYMIIRNCILNILNEIEDWELHPLIGADREEIEILLEKLKKISPPPMRDRSTEEV